MNNDRRKDIATSIEALAEIQANLSAVLDAVTQNLDEEQEAFENMPEGLQQSERGQASEAASDELYEAVSQIEEIDDLIDEIVAHLEAASE